MLPSNLNVALKEWSIVCQALQTGRQIVLLRKGGIVEAIGGFELEHSRFLLFPTFLHQNVAMLKAEERADLVPSESEPAKIEIRSAAEVTDIIQLSDRAQMDAIDTEHIWAPPLIDMRFNYRPKNPLYLLIVRSYLHASAVTIDNTPEYAGCKSWVPLANAIDCHGARPTIDEDAFQSRREKIIHSING